MPLVRYKVYNGHYLEETKFIMLLSFVGLCIYNVDEMKKAGQKLHSYNINYIVLFWTDWYSIYTELCFFILFP